MLANGRGWTSPFWDTRNVILETLVHRDTGGRLTTTVYRKPTHTDQYVAYDSHHPKSVKRGVVKCLYERASRIVSKPHCTAPEKQHVSSALVSNGYPISFVNRASRKKRTTSEEPARFNSTVVLPYVDSIAHTLRRRLEKHDIRVVFKSDTIRNQLVRPKDPVLPDRRDGVVYKIPCSTCDKVYIGETGRPVSYIAQDKHWYTRRVKEAIHIRLHPNNINRDSGIDIPDEWLSAIRRHSTNRFEPVRDSTPPATAGNNSSTAPGDWPLTAANHNAGTPRPIAGQRHRPMAVQLAPQ
ncbi:uncharacterized protein [Diadema antillarum]|uniref:uncharacterized protein n=1 Tax=Diadema antillarum TaxID=105358 RepID=UPI003A8B6AE8